MTGPLPVARLTLQAIRVFKTFLFVGLCAAVPTVAAAQTPSAPIAAASESSEVEKLQAIVAEQVQTAAAYLPPGPARRLAALYAAGSIVPRDVVLACSLASFARLMSGERDARDNAVCDALTGPERSVATNSFDCFLFGLETGTMRLGAHTVVVDRLGIRLAGAPVEPAHRAGSRIPCAVLVARLQPRTVAPPDGAAPGVGERSFVELLTWQSGGMTTAGRYVLHWTMFEVQSGKMAMVVDVPFRETIAWPSPPLPSDVADGIAMEMVRSGNVRYRIQGAPPSRGWILMPGKEER